MIDPIVSLLLGQPEEQATQNADSRHIRVEEAIDCRNSNQRLFSMLNRDSSLQIIVSAQSTVTNCQLDGQEIVLSQALRREPHETWAPGERPHLKLCNLLWNSHVRGSELILSSSSPLSSQANLRNLMPNQNDGHPHTTLHYELTRSNELNCIGKLKSIHLQHQVFYFNLKRALPPDPIQGHRLAVRCNGSLREIQVQPTKLLCQCNRSQAAPLPNEMAQSLVTDIPFELTQRLVDSTAAACGATGSEEVIICDTVYSRESTSPHDFIEAQLQFAHRSVTFEVRSGRPVVATAAAASLPTGSSNNNNNSNVSSSTYRSKSAKQAQARARDSANTDLIQRQVSVDEQPANNGCNATYSANEQQQQGQQQVDDSIATSSTPNVELAGGVRVKAEPRELAANSQNLPSAPQMQYANNNAKVAPSSSQHPSTTLRIRLVVTNFGVAMLPHMMTNYTSSYRFSP